MNYDQSPFWSLSTVRLCPLNCGHALSSVVNKSLKYLTAFHLGQRLILLLSTFESENRESANSHFCHLSFKKEVPQRELEDTTWWSKTKNHIIHKKQQWDPEAKIIPRRLWVGQPRELAHMSAITGQVAEWTLDISRVYRTAGKKYAYFKT